uniref:Transmembrane protein n=1 Tax=Peronospora matthiolae TaxID=2874970 RepID=A0AAV1UFX8_9STRA
MHARFSTALFAVTFVFSFVCLTSAGHSSVEGQTKGSPTTRRVRLASVVPEERGLWESFSQLILRKNVAASIHPEPPANSAGQLANEAGVVENPRSVLSFFSDETCSVPRYYLILVALFFGMFVLEGLRRVRG